MTVSMSTLRSLYLAVSIAMACCRWANAQPLFDDLPTLEWRTAQADLVLTARILDFEVEMGGRGVSRLGLTLGTIETIKGNAASVVEVSIDTPGVLDTVAEGLAKRRDAGTIDAWFLTSQSDTDIFGGIGHGLEACVLPLTDWPTTGKPESWLRRPLAPAVTMDFVRHDGKADILDALRRIVKDEPPHAESRTPPWGHRLQLSFISDLHLWPECGNWYHPTVPADARLEALARRMIQRPASFFDPLPESASDNDRRSRGFHESSIRREGARALAIHFESADNARLLATLLDDTGTGLYSPHGIAEPTRHLYTTRKIAWDAITEWGFDAPEPILERPMVDASLAPTEGAVRAVHGPRGEGVTSAEFLIELGGNHTPELLRLYFHATDQPTQAIDLERFRAQGATCLGFSVFSLVDNQPVLAMHAGGDNGPITLTLERFGGHVVLVARDPGNATEPLAYDWWDTRGEDGGPFWEARAGTWNTKMHRFDTTARHAPIRFIAGP